MFPFCLSGSKDCQLVTWSRDQTLRMWRVDCQLQRVGVAPDGWGGGGLAARLSGGGLDHQFLLPSIFLILEWQRLFRVLGWPCYLSVSWRGSGLSPRTLFSRSLCSCLLHRNCSNHWSFLIVCSGQALVLQHLELMSILYPSPPLS